MWHIWERRVMNTEFWWTNLKKNGHLEDLGIDGRMILKRTLNSTEWDCMDLIHMALDRHNLQALVSTIKDL